MSTSSCCLCLTMVSYDVKEHVVKPDKCLQLLKHIAIVIVFTVAPILWHVITYQPAGHLHWQFKAIVSVSLFCE